MQDLTPLPLRGKLTAVQRETLIAAVLILGTLAALGAWQAGWLGSAGARHATRPVAAAEVPSTLPDGGVRINDVVLRRWVSAPSRAMSASQAITAARKYANAQPFRARALGADVTLLGEKLTLRDSAGHLRPVDLHGVPSWVVTFTSPKPIDVNQGPPGSGPINVTHFSVVLNAVTRAFVVGFFTR